MNIEKGLRWLFFFMIGDVAAPVNGFNGFLVYCLGE